MAIKLVLKGRDGQLSTVLQTKTGIVAKKIERAAGQAARDMARDIKRRGDADIRAGGKFRQRWTSAFKANVEGAGLTSKVKVTMDVPYWRIFQFGGVIKGKPMLWIPLSFAKDAQGVSAKDFGGGLFRVDRKNGGAPLLLSIKDGQPKYFGKTSVTEKKRFHLIEVSTASLANFGNFFFKRLKVTN